jgi:hypothetical protein
LLFLKYSTLYPLQDINKSKDSIIIICLVIFKF